MVVLARSFNYTGCLANREYKENLLSGTDDIIAANKEFFDEIKAKKLAGISQIYTLNGSNRQFFYINEHYRKNNTNGSCFDAILKVSKHLNTTFLPFLMADVDGEVEDIDAWFRMAQAAALDYEHNPYFYDKSKVGLLYAQMHYVASLHPNEDIIFDFYDGRLYSLVTLLLFYSNKDGVLLIPSNVTLRLNFYNGYRPKYYVEARYLLSETMYELIERIQGAGDFDPQYRLTSKNMIVLAIFKQLEEQLRNGLTSIDVARYISPTDFITYKENSKQESSSELPYVDEFEYDSDVASYNSEAENDSSKSEEGITRQAFKDILDAYQTTNWLYKYFFCCFGLKRSATMTALYDLLENNPTQAGFTIEEVGNKIHTCTDGHRQHRFFLFKGLPEEKSNGTGTDKVVENLRNAFCKSLSI